MRQYPPALRLRHAEQANEAYRRLGSDWNAPVPTPSIVQALLRILQSGGDGPTRFAAAKALGRALKAPTLDGTARTVIVEALLSTLKSGDKWTCAVPLALGEALAGLQFDETTRSAILQALLHALECGGDEVWWIRKGAAMAFEEAFKSSTLEVAGHAAIIRALLRVLESSDHLRVLGKSAVALSEALKPARLKGAVRASIRTAGRRAIECGDYPAANDFVRALNSSNPRRKVHVATERTERLLGWLESSDDTGWRKAAASCSGTALKDWKLDGNASSAIIQALIRILESSDDATYKREAAKALGKALKSSMLQRTARAKIIQALLCVFESEDDESIKESVAKRFGEAADGTDEEERSRISSGLLHALATIKNGRCKDVAIESLGRLALTDRQLAALLPYVSSFAGMRSLASGRWRSFGSRDDIPGLRFFSLDSLYEDALRDSAKRSATTFPRSAGTT